MERRMSPLSLIKGITWPIMLSIRGKSPEIEGVSASILYTQTHIRKENTKTKAMFGSDRK